MVCVVLSFVALPIIVVIRRPCSHGPCCYCGCSCNSSAFFLVCCCHVHCGVRFFRCPVHVMTLMRVKFAAEGVVEVDHQQLAHGADGQVGELSCEEDARRKHLWRAPTSNVNG